MSHYIGGLRKADDNGNDNLHVHHSFFYFFLDEDHDVTLPNKTFCGGREHKIIILFFFFLS